MLSAGAQAPAFTLSDLSGNRHSLATFLERGPVLLALFKISCPTCQMTMPYLDRLASNRTPSVGALQVIGISQDDERGTARFLQTLRLTMATLLDPETDGYAVSNAFAITHVPSLFLVETDGKISTASNGFSKYDLESIGHRAGVQIFGGADNVPEWKAG